MLNNTADIRRKMINLWDKFDEGKLPTPEARTHIGFARTVLETLKVEIAAAHVLNMSPVSFDKKSTRIGKMVE
jgi:hypothetical protein